jgi:hypothetical protein
MKDHETYGSHLSSEEVAAYIDGAISGSDREQIESHLADCEECRRELVEVRTALRQFRRTPDWRIIAPAAVAAAAVIALLALPSLLSDPDSARDVRVRGPDESVRREGVPLIAVVNPLDGSTIEMTEGLVFHWRAPAADASYQLTLGDDAGEVVWTLSTTDTLVTLPESVRLGPGSIYYWYVDALLPDGRSATTEVLQFMTAQ